MMLSKHTGYVTGDEVGYKRYRGQTANPLGKEKSVPTVSLRLFLRSTVEQPDIIFSVEQTRCGQLDKAEPQSPALPPDDYKTTAVCSSDHEQLVHTNETEDVSQSPRSTADLFLTLEDPEELLQLALEAGDCVVPLPGGETCKRHFYLQHNQSFILEKKG